MAPCEVEEATVDWFDENREILVIPSEHAAKEREKEEIVLLPTTVQILEVWINEQRPQYTGYEGTELLWLNQEENPCQSGTLCNLVRSLYDFLGIDTENRRIVWYSLRHNLGTYLEKYGSLAESSDQLRHSSLETTGEFYAGTSTEQRRQSLMRINQAAMQEIDQRHPNVYGAYQFEPVDGRMPHWQRAPPRPPQRPIPTRYNVRDELYEIDALVRNKMGGDPLKVHVGRSAQTPAFSEAWNDGGRYRSESRRARWGEPDERRE